MINSLYMLLFLTTSFSFFSFLIQYIVYRLWKSNTQVIKKAIFCHGRFILQSHPILEGIHLPRRDVYQYYRSKVFKPTLIPYFLPLLALIIPELGLKTKETENQPRLKNVNLNLILTHNIYIIIKVI